MDLHKDLLDIGNIHITWLELLRTAFVFVVAFTLLWLLRSVANRWARRYPGTASRVHSVRLLLTYFIWVFAIISALRTLGIDITFLLAGSAALLVGIGLGIQQTFNDIVSGIIILVEGTIRVGDVLEIEGLVGVSSRSPCVPPR